MFRLIGNEVFKIFATKKIYGVIIVMIMFSFLPGLESAMGTLNFPLNGQTLPLYMFAAFANLIIPIFIIVTLGDLLTDEYIGGTLKLPLLHPVSRMKLLTAKLLALIVPVTMLLMIGMVTSYIVGTVLFGWGDHFLFNDMVQSTERGVITTLGFYLTSVVPLLAFASMVMLICLQFSSSGAAVAVSVGLLVSFSILGQIVVALRTYLIITYFQELSNHLFFTGDFSKIVNGLIVIFVYGGIFYLASVRHFKNKDLIY